jgi:hypothetical protein
MTNDNELVNRLAEQIKGKEESAAIAQKEQVNRMEYIKANCPRFFLEVTGYLSAQVDRLNAALAGSDTANPLAVFENDSTTSFVISKGDFPSVRGAVQLNIEGLSITCNLLSALSLNDQPVLTAGALAFDMDANAQLLSLRTPPGSQLPPLNFSTPKEFADFVLTTLFTV